MEHTKISVVVFIHNDENFIIRCVESIVFQFHANLEILLYCSDSYDQSKNVCEKISQTYKRVKVLTCENETETNRIDIFSHITGDYILFMKATEFLSPHFITAMLGMAEIFHSSLSLAPVYRTDSFKPSLNQFECYTDKALAKLKKKELIGLYHRNFLKECINTLDTSVFFARNEQLAQALLLNTGTIAYTTTALYFRKQ